MREKYGTSRLADTDWKSSLVQPQLRLQTGYSQINKYTYKTLKTLGNYTDWQDTKRKLEEVYYPIAMEAHAASGLHWKQRPDETLQEYIQSFTNLTGKAMWIDPANITNHEIIFLFRKTLYKKDIGQ